MNHFDLSDIYKTLHQTITEHVSFSVAYGTFTKIDHIYAINKSQQILKI